jgi:hypothetical protein
MVVVMVSDPEVTVARRAEVVMAEELAAAEDSVEDSAEPLPEAEAVEVAKVDDSAELVVETAAQ